MRCFWCFRPEGKRGWPLSSGQSGAGLLTGGSLIYGTRIISGSHGPGFWKGSKVQKEAKQSKEGLISPCSGELSQLGVLPCLALPWA